MEEDERVQTDTRSSISDVSLNTSQSSPSPTVSDFAHGTKFAIHGADSEVQLPTQDSADISSSCTTHQSFTR